MATKLMQKHEVGIKKRTHTLLEIDDVYFAEGEAVEPPPIQDTSSDPAVGNQKS
jgi:hypothetical protein